MGTSDIESVSIAQPLFVDGLLQGVAESVRSELVPFLTLTLDKECTPGRQECLRWLSMAK